MLPSILAGQLEKGIGDYIETTYPMTNEPFKGSIQKMLQTKDSVYHEPYIAVRLPFRVAESMPDCFEAIHPSYLPYVHQQKAFARLTGDDGRSTLVATGTGSGKTECFLYPILEYCYQHRGERGIKALIIYPMNALATDQAKRIAELIYGSKELRGNVTVGMYVGGQESTPSRVMSEHGVITDHETMLNSAPDILMTNYKMLDYLLVRPKDAQLWQDNGPETLKYIAVDELHTFDGAQGTDLACLLRRLKRRLGIFDGYLCCIGTSATMGSKENNENIIDYASEIFGEPFDNDSVITEDRLSPQEYFAGINITEFHMPNVDQCAELSRLSSEDDADTYLKEAVRDWFPESLQYFSGEGLSDTDRILLGDLLKHHSFMQSVINLTGGNYYQASAIAEELDTHYPELKQLPDVTVLINSLFALISHARTGSEGHLRPFLNVQVQLWMKELRRLLAKVDPENVSYEISEALNGQQAKQYLPVINCRDCGITGWVSILNERSNATMTNLKAFYNQYFKADDKIVMMFPHSHQDDIPGGMVPARLCPDCLQVKLGDDGTDTCPSCGAEMIDVMIPTPIKTSGSKDHKQYICPCCGSRRGLSLMGLRSATEISASISQMFASKFNDDKKTLAFSDNVQDAAHRAGFFNARTWRFGLRTAIQRYCNEFGAGESLAAFQEGFLKYWHTRMTAEEFVSFFIAPNMTWKHAYEDMVEKRELGKDKQAQILMYEVEQRLRYEIMLEYGLTGKIGRTLEKSGCSVLAFYKRDIDAIAEAVQERTVNELGVLTSESLDSFKRMVLGYLNLMRMNGAFEDKVFDEYTLGDGNGYMLSNDRNRWLPGRQSGRNTPRFMAVPTGYKRSYEFDSPSTNKYVDWLVSCSHEVIMEESNYRAISRFILDEAVRCGVLALVPSSANFKVYGIKKDHGFISSDVVQMRCDTCGSVYAVAAENAEIMQGAPCQRTNCGGFMEEKADAGLGYYGRLYSSGDMSRINAREHTGLLERPDREQLEVDFKRGKDSLALWDPNVLSCTPTLEMGIDIGDLSTVILCSMPPAQSQFLQRAGRAGRKDGNALTLAIANAKPHDLYFYTDPLDMISGKVTPPRIFLRASAVLERQFMAFCMDSWVRKGIPEGAIPDKVGKILNNLESRPDNMFPFNFLNYVQSKLSYLLNSFIQMFAAYLDNSAREELQVFARGKKDQNSPMYLKVLDAFQTLKKQQDALRGSVDSLKEMIKELEAKPKDSSYDEEIKDLKSEEAALLDVLREVAQKNVFNFLSDEGLLPNYAFPEAGIILRAVLYRKEDETSVAAAPTGKKKFQKMVYEYSRSASSAISEFAPNNNFYVDGRKLTIDQVDLTTAQTAKWRLCPNCSHAQIEEAGKNVAACPQCGSPAWADQGQVRTMLKVQMVYSNMDYTRSLINDESEDRSNIFYTKQLLVDVDEDHDISGAYRMDNQEFPFGYEFVRKATLREINFGESDSNGEKLTVSGKEEVRKGFKICKYCGKIQPGGKGKPNHTFSCKTRKMTTLMQEDAFEECLFLYREFNTEILRLLIPATTLDSSQVKMESFVAAFMLGMKEYFGNVDHLRATVSEVPVPDADYRKQYLVIYDSVPGGTGYLKQLMHEKNALIEIFEKSLHVMENCTCKDDPQKDGCYHCLYAYRQSQQLSNISRASAIHMLKAILSGKDNIEVIKKINDIPVNPLFDSELEQRFMEAVRSKVGAANVKDTIRNGKHSYYIMIGDTAWEIEPQVTLDAEYGVKVKSKPDFVFWPKSNADENHKPVAVFTDGFTYHNNEAADDTLKREAIRRSGNFRVWSLSYQDVQNVFYPLGDYATSTLDYVKMPYGTKMYQNMIKNTGAEVINPSQNSAFDLLISYLTLPDAERIFKLHADAYSMSLVSPALIKSSLAFNSWKTIVDPIADQTHYTDYGFAFPGTIYGTWIPRDRNSHLVICAGIPMKSLQQKEPVSVCAILKDEKEFRTDKYEQEWNGMWHFWNVMQFADQFIAVSSLGMTHMDYLALPIPGPEEDIVLSGQESADHAAWDALKDMFFDDETKAFADMAADAGIPAPQEEWIGYEAEGPDGEVAATIEIAWPDRKIGFLTAEQQEDKETLIQLGWKIADITNIEETAKLFGGKN